MTSAPDVFLHPAPPPPPVHNQAGPVQIVVGQALNYMPNVQYDKHKNIVIGKMEHTCSHCQASKWAGEAPGLCCSGGKVVFPLLAPPPKPLKELLRDNSANAVHFRKNTRKYNACFSMTAFKTQELQERGYSPTFRLQEQVYHPMPSILPAQGQQPRFVQVYFMGDYNN